MDTSTGKHSDLVDIMKRVEAETFRPPDAMVMHTGMTCVGSSGLAFFDRDGLQRADVQVQAESLSHTSCLRDDLDRDTQGRLKDDVVTGSRLTDESDRNTVCNRTESVQSQPSGDRGSSSECSPCPAVRSPPDSERAGSAGCSPNPAERSLSMGKCLGSSECADGWGDPDCTDSHVPREVATGLCEVYWRGVHLHGRALESRIQDTSAAFLRSPAGSLPFTRLFILSSEQNSAQRISREPFPAGACMRACFVRVRVRVRDTESWDRVMWCLFVLFPTHTLTLPPISLC